MKKDSEILRKSMYTFLFVLCAIAGNTSCSSSDDQKSQIKAFSGLGYIDPTGAFLYSEPIAMPTIENTDYLFN